MGLCQREDIIAFGCFAFCEQLLLKDAQIFGASGQTDPHCKIYLTYTFTMLHQMKNLRTNYKGFKKTFDIFPFHHIVLNQMKDCVAISFES